MGRRIERQGEVFQDVYYKHSGTHSSHVLGQRASPLGNMAGTWASCCRAARRWRACRRACACSRPPWMPRRAQPLEHPHIGFSRLVHPAAVHALSAMAHGATLAAVHTLKLAWSPPDRAAAETAAAAGCACSWRARCALWQRCTWHRCGTPPPCTPSQLPYTCLCFFFSRRLAAAWHCVRKLPWVSVRLGRSTVVKSGRRCAWCG